MTHAPILAIIVIVLLVIIVILVLRRKNKARSAARKTLGQMDQMEQGDITNKQVYVGNLSYQVNEQNLKEFFSKYGAITQVRIVKNYGSGRSKGFGFVTFNTTKEAEKALAAHGQKYQERTIVVRIAKPR